MAMTNKAVFEQLKSLGSDTSHEFVQGNKSSLATELGGVKLDLSGGFCDGLCHDWVRRVLQGGKLHFGEGETEVRAVQRAGFGQEHLLDPKIQMSIGFQQYQASFDMEKALKGTGSPVTLQPNTVQTLVRAGYLSPKQKTTNNAYPRKLIETLYEKVGKQGTDTVQNKRAETGTKWQLTSYYWDDKWRKERKRLGKGVSQHPFYNIQKVDSEERTEALYNSVYDGVCAKFQVLTLGNMAIILSFKAGKLGESGHAIAVHRNNTGSYRFFDPNFGIFNYNNAEAAATAVIFIIGYAYPAMGWQTLEDHNKLKLGHKHFVAASETFERKEQRVTLSRGAKQYRGENIVEGSHMVSVVNDPPLLNALGTKERILKKAEQMRQQASGGEGKGVIY